MSTLSNIFAADDADQAPDGASQSTANEADIAPGTPGYEPDMPDDKPPEMLMPGGPDDPAA